MGIFVVFYEKNMNIPLDNTHIMHYNVDTIQKII